MIENRKCPYCDRYVVGKGDYVRGKQGVKQFFHYECLLAASIGGKHDTRSNYNIRSDNASDNK